MTFPYQRLAILGILWSVATVASCGQVVAGVHSKHFTTVNFQTPLFLQKTNPLNKGWTVFKDTLGAFSIELPNYPTCKSLNNSFLPPYEYDVVGLKMHLFKSMDAAGNTYVIRYNDLPAGRSLSDMDAFFKENLSQLWQNHEPKILKVNNLDMNGYAGRYIVYEVQHMEIHVRCWLRGNRVYLLVLQPPALVAKGDKKVENDFSSAEKWFDSFQFEPFAPTTFVTQPLKNEKYMVGVPVGTLPIHVSESEHPGDYPEVRETTWRVTSPQSGVSFSIAQIRFSQYYAPENEDSLCHRFLRWRFNRIPEQMTIIDTTFQGQKAKSLRFKLDKRGTIYRNIMFRIGTECYELSAHLPHEVSEESFIKTFCDKFKFVNPPHADNLQQFYMPKTDILLQHLLSNDTHRIQARAILPEYHFKKEDLNKLYSVVLANYDDDSLQMNSTRYLLLDKIMAFPAFEQDADRVDCLKNLFFRDTTATILQARILTDVFAKTFTNHSNSSKLFENLFFNLANQWNVSAVTGINLANSILNDARYAQKEHFDKMAHLYQRMMQELYDKKSFKLLLNQLSIQLLDGEAACTQLVDDFQALFVARVQSLTMKVPQMESLQEALCLVPILGKLRKNQLIINVLRKNINSNKIALAAETALAYVQQGEVLPTTVWKRLFADKNVWYHTLVQLSEMRQLKVIPREYLSHAEVVKAIIYGRMGYELENMLPEQIQIIEKREITHNNKNLFIFVFRAVVFDADWNMTEFYGVCSQPAMENQYSLAPDIFKIDVLPEQEKDWKPMIWNMLQE
ncbi:MAG: hypothetical protein RL329_3865 [Bacteroidota bacterium]